MIKIQQLKYFVSVYEERSFTAAAEREHATQSGVSTHVKELEHRIGAVLFERGPTGVTPTPVGERLYAHALGVMRALSALEEDVGALSRAVTGRVRVGLMPAFTRAALAPALDAFAAAHPHVEIAVVEAYSAALTDMTARAELDFAIVPAGPLPASVTARTLATDREFLVTRADCGMPHLAPVDVGALGPLSLVVPGPANARRAAIERALSQAGVRVARRLELDAMMGTLDLVARSDFVAILPGVLVAPDRDGGTRRLHPLPAALMTTTYLLIEPSTRVLSRAAALFATALEAEIGRTIALMAETA